MRETSAKSTPPRRQALPSKGWIPSPRQPKCVGEFLPRLMKPAFEKYGFSASVILTGWDALVGPDLAAYTLPERLKWPPRSREGGNSASVTGATLILRCDGARALEVDHLRDQILDRVNAAFGYRAVNGIKLIQAPVATPDHAAKPRIHAAVDPNNSGLRNLPDSPLKQALTRLEQGIQRKKSLAA